MFAIALAAAMFFGGDCPELPEPLGPDETVFGTEEFERLPSRDDAAREVGKNLSFSAWLCKRREAAAAWELERFDIVEAENNQLYWTWDLIYRIQDDNRPTINRQRDINELRQRIGDEAFFGGVWPPAFPWWRIPRGD